MLWFFDRDAESLTLETRYDDAQSKFVAVVRYPDGSEQTERFATLDDFRRWLDAFDELLQQENWRGRGQPVVLPYGWLNQRLH